MISAVFVRPAGMISPCEKQQEMVHRTMVKHYDDRGLFIV